MMEESDYLIAEYGVTASGRRTDELFSTRKTLEQIMAEFFKIDLKTLSMENDAMLEEISRMVEKDG